MSQFKKAARGLSVLACAATAIACGADGKPATGNAQVIAGDPVAAQSAPTPRTELRRTPSDIVPVAPPRSYVTLTDAERMVPTHARDVAFAHDREGADVDHGSGGVTW